MAITTDDQVVQIVTSFDMDAPDKTTALKMMIQRLVDHGNVSDGDAFLKDVFHREDEMPTYIGFQIGLPHSQSQYVKHSAVCVGRLKQPITWHGDDKVNLIFMIAVPTEAKGKLHLQILASLSRMLMHEEFRQKLGTLDAAGVEKLMDEHMDYKRDEEQ